MEKDQKMNECFQNFIIMETIRKYLSENDFGNFVCILGNPANYEFEKCVCDNDGVINIGSHFSI